VHQLTVAHVGNDCAPQVQRLGTKCDIIVNSFFEEDGYPEALQHAELRKTGRIVGRTRLGKLRGLRVRLNATSGLWPSKKATHKGPTSVGNRLGAQQAQRRHNIRHLCRQRSRCQFKCVRSIDACPPLIHAAIAQGAGEVKVAGAGCPPAPSASMESMRAAAAAAAAPPPPPQ
jgi:hypothetical protein